MGLFDPPQSNSTSSTTTNPYPAARKGLNTGLADALSLYKKRQLNPYTPMSTETRGGLIGQQRAAGNAIGPLNEALAKYRGFSQGTGDISSAGQMGIRNMALGPSMSESNLGGIARGDLIGQGDPNYDRLRQRALEDASTEAGMQASGIGRTGSDFHQAAVGSRVADTVGAMDYQRLQDERNRQVEANSLIDQMRQAGYGIGLNAQNSASAIQGSNVGRRMDAAGSIPGMVEATYSPYERITNVGRSYDVDRAAKAGVPGSNISSLMQLLGVASPYGTTSGQGMQQEPGNEAGGWAGAGLGLASLLFG